MSIPKSTVGDLPSYAYFGGKRYQLASWAEKRNIDRSLTSLRKDGWTNLHKRMFIHPQYGKCYAIFGTKK